MGCPSGAGDRYLLKLFRDFVFHQMDEEGRPILDWGHMVEALNKLDAAVPEQVSCLLGFVCVCVCLLLFVCLQACHEVFRVEKRPCALLCCLHPARQWLSPS